MPHPGHRVLVVLLVLGNLIMLTSADDSEGKCLCDKCRPGDDCGESCICAGYNGQEMRCVYVSFDPEDYPDYELNDTDYSRSAPKRETALTNAD
uniref:Putative secreted protein n=1 Tax=Ornithodoros turicata TaxID=34597 RepID=A0A2R5LCE5_9ACAR